LTKQLDVDAAATLIAATLLVVGVVVTTSAVATPGCYPLTFVGSDSFACELVENAGLGLVVVGGVGLVLSWMNIRIKRRGKL
jgi:hypothetical protein